MDILLSPKHGLNPTIPICFWCGKEKNEIALMGRIGDARKGEDFEAPMQAVFDYEPCDRCREKMSLGFTLIEATTAPNQTTRMQMQPGVYPTGRYAVIREEAARRLFVKTDLSKGKAFVDHELFDLVLSSG